MGASWAQSHTEALAARSDRAAVASASRAARRVLAAARASQSIAAATTTNSASDGSWAGSAMANDQPGGMTKNQAASIESTVADTVGPTPKNQAEARNRQVIEGVGRPTLQEPFERQPQQRHEDHAGQDGRMLLPPPSGSPSRKAQNAFVDTTRRSRRAVPQPALLRQVIRGKGKSGPGLSAGRRSADQAPEEIVERHHHLGGDGVAVGERKPGHLQPGGGELAAESIGGRERQHIVGAAVGDEHGQPAPPVEVAS